MPEPLHKFRPDADLQCYFQHPSAIAALSETSEHGFTISGSWRQQFDWAVLEWNRDNVFEHPALRNLPDGDLSGLHLSYEEERTNCIPLDSTSYESVGWPYLRIWAGDDVDPYKVTIRDYATPVAGEYVQPSLSFELQGALTTGDHIELAWLGEHYNYLIAPGDTRESAVAALAEYIHGHSVTVDATADGAKITLTYMDTTAVGSNGNRVGVYGTVAGAKTEVWSPSCGVFSGGASPQRWCVSLDFGQLADKDGRPVPATNVRKVRWTWCADLQSGNYERSEFQVRVTNWQVTGTHLDYSVAGPGGRRIEDDAPEVVYSGAWTEERGNYSGGSIRYTSTPTDRLECQYQTGLSHTLYLGTRKLTKGAAVAVQIDSGPIQPVNLNWDAEDVLVRLPLAELAAGSHTVRVTHRGANGDKLYFDFLEIAVPTSDLPIFNVSPTTTLATDWDTDHSLAIAPERTAWLIQKLGFRGRANHYVGAQWFYELCNRTQQYASASISFVGTPEFGSTTTVMIAGSTIDHLNLIGDTADSIAKSFELVINAGASSVWARSNGNTVIVTARVLGEIGNIISIAAETGSTNFTATTSGPMLSGGFDGTWLTDLNATPRINRAARDWTRSFVKALQGYGIDAASAFSMELRHGDDSAEAAIAQRYPNEAVWLNTPALQTNFSPASTEFWRQVYLDMARVMVEAGTRPYLQFGEVQWWYFANDQGMPFYDAYTTNAFQSSYGRPMAIIPSQNANPSLFADECSFLPGLIGEFTNAIVSFVRQTYPDALFEVLYPPDVNDTPLNRLINYPPAQWTPATLACLKTENFTFTGDRNLDEARESIALPAQLGFPPAQSSHLVGIGEYTTPWNKERRLALGDGLESVVLFALDQFCLIGYGLPLDEGLRRSVFMGG